MNAQMFSALPAEAYVAAMLAMAGALCLAFGARIQLARARTDARLMAHVGTHLEVVTTVSDEPGFRTRALDPLMGWLADVANRLLPERQVSQIRTNLAIAGMRSSRHLTQFLAAKVGLTIGLAFFIFSFYSGSFVTKLLLTVLGAALGYYLPGIWLGRKMSQRKNQILKALPDSLDLLSISVSAGLGFDGGLLEVVQRWQNALTLEFAAVLRDLKLGNSRRDALRDFSHRTGVEEISNFVAAIIQAEELGSPIKEVLNIQAEQMRQQRRYRAEERARKAVIKMLIPMVFLIFPAMFVVLLGPAIPSLVSALSATSG